MHGENLKLSFISPYNIDGLVFVTVTKRVKL